MLGGSTLSVALRQLLKLNNKRTWCPHCMWVGKSSGVAELLREPPKINWFNLKCVKKNVIYKSLIAHQGTLKICVHNSQRAENNNIQCTCLWHREVMTMSAMTSSVSTKTMMSVFKYVVWFWHCNVYKQCVHESFHYPFDRMWLTSRKQMENFNICRYGESMPVFSLHGVMFSSIYCCKV